MLYQAKFQLGHVALNVKNLELQSAFYQQVLGLELLEKKADSILLGAGGKGLVRLLTTEDKSSNAASYGLYHLAIVLPSRADLGSILQHFLSNQVPLVGASNHGYSEAIYLEDTEGNGIEIYRDLPESDWDIRSDGRIVGITEAMDAEGVLAAADQKDLSQAYSMPEEARMGHVHLSVKSSQASSAFYQDVLDLDDKFTVPSASWIASGNYHHHIAVNEWAGQHLAKRQAAVPGLAYYSIVYDNVEDYRATIKRAQAAGLDLDLQSNQVAFVDIDGIKTQLVLG